LLTKFPFVPKLDEQSATHTPYPSAWVHSISSTCFNSSPLEGGIHQIARCPNRQRKLCYLTVNYFIYFELCERYRGMLTGFEIYYVQNVKPMAWELFGQQARPINQRMNF